MSTSKKFKSKSASEHSPEKREKLNNISEMFEEATIRQSRNSTGRLDRKIGNQSTFLSYASSLFSESKESRLSCL